MSVLRRIIRSFSHPPLPRWVSLLAAVGLAAYALYDAAQASGSRSPAAVVSAWGIPLADKWVHIAGYGAVALLLCQGLIGRDGSGLPKAVAAVSGRMVAVSKQMAARVSGRRLAVADPNQAWEASAWSVIWATLALVLLSTALSAVAELIQQSAGLGRSPELEDVLASGLGAAMAGVGFLVCRWV